MREVSGLNHDSQHKGTATMITFTTERHVFDSKPVVEVRWNDANETMLRVHATFAAIYHAGELHIVNATSKNREATRRYWTERITKRLESIQAQPVAPAPLGKFGQMVRDGWKPLTVADNYQPKHM